MKIIALANEKGGVAKTTSCYNLAWTKANEGKRVCMVDLDPQASLTISAGLNAASEEYQGKNTAALFDPKINPAECAYTVDASGLETLYIVPSNIGLARTEMELFTMSSREKRLKRALKKLESYFDYIFIDCPPQLGLLTINALTAADEVLIPCATNYLSYMGLQALLDTIKDFQNDPDLNPQLKIDGIIATRYTKRINDQRDVLELMQKLQPVVGIIKEATDVSREVYLGKPVVQTHPTSEPALEYVKIATQI